MAPRNRPDDDHTDDPPVPEHVEPTEGASSVGEAAHELAAAEPTPAPVRGEPPAPIAASAEEKADVDPGGEAVSTTPEPTRTVEDSGLERETGRPPLAQVAQELAKPLKERSE